MKMRELTAVQWTRIRFALIADAERRERSEFAEEMSGEIAMNREIAQDIEDALEADGMRQASRPVGSPRD